MATFIAYQPEANPLRFGNSTFSISPTVIGSSTCVSSRQSLKSHNQTKSVGKADSVDFVDLTDSHQDTPRECLVLRDFLEPMGHDPDNRGMPDSRDGSSCATCNDKVEAGEEGDKDGDDVDFESEASDLPSLHEIFAQSKTQVGGSDEFGREAFASPAPVSRTREERGRAGDSEEIGNPAAATVTSVQLGASQDNPIVLYDDQPVDAHHKATVLDGEKPAFEVADPADPIGPSPNSSGERTDPRANDGKNAAGHLAKYNTDNCACHEQTGNTSHKEDAVHTQALARGNRDSECSGSDSGTESDTPASVGRIHDVFAEYEETFGLLKSKQKAVHSTLPDCLASETTEASIPCGVIQGEPRVAADDGVTDVEQAAEAVGDDVARPSKREIENGSIFHPQQEIDGQETKTGDPRSQGGHALAGDCHSENMSAFLQYPPSLPPMTADDAIGSDPGAVAQGAPYRKRALLSVQPGVLLDGGTPLKRPRRTTKETWKAREAREAREARGQLKVKRSLTPLHPYRKEYARFTGFGCVRSEVDYRVANIEDVFLGEDDSIQCVVSWKSSLISMENLFDDELRRRCEELFRKRYGHREFQKRATSKQLPQKPTQKS